MSSDCTDASYISHDAENEGESGAAIEEETLNESTCTGVDIDENKVIGEGIDHIHVGTLTKEEDILSSETGGYQTNKSNDLLSWNSLHDSSKSQEEEKVGLDAAVDNNVNVAPGDLSAPSFTDLTARESVSPNTNERMGQISVAEHLNCLSEGVSFSHDFGDEIEPPHSNVNIGEPTIEAFDSEDGQPPPVPFSLHSRVFEDGPKSKHDQVGKNVNSDRKYGTLTPHMICFTDAPVTESSILPRTLPPEADFETQNRDSSNQEVAEQSSDRNLSPPIVPGTLNLPTADLNVISSNERVQEDEEMEDVTLIPEAVPVQQNALIENPDVRVAQLVEPDQSMMSLKKIHALVISAMILAAVMALGLTLYFTGRNAPSSVTFFETSDTFRPSSQPSFVPLSSQRSLSIRNAIEKNVLQRNVTFDGMEDTNSRVFALDWIINDDEMGLISSDSNLFQRFILVLLAFEFSIPGWLSGSYECSWIGVECDTYGHIVKLELIDNGFEGTMPPEIGGLQYLQDLLLRGNSLYGTLPSEIGKLKALSNFSIDLNNFTSTLPSEIGNLKQLVEFSLNQNEFTGTLPLELGNLTKLARLSLNRNLLEGTLPSELGRLKDLTVLSISLNEFTGTLPSEFRNLNKLSAFYFNGNQFMGTFPPELCLLSNVPKIYGHNNQLTGTLPSELGSMHMLTRLYLDSNIFTGTLPSELGNLRNLTDLWFYNNQLTGTLPSELGNLEEMKVLVISQNLFTGTLPTEIGRMKKLVLGRFNENQLNGTLPTELGGLEVLERLYVFKNQFSGTIPSELQNLTSLTALSIYSNRFTGPLPPWLGTLDKLSILYVSANQLTGTIPSELSRLTELTHFGVDLNKFSGTVPSWIGDLSNLSILWLDGNQFTGTFPTEIGNNLDLEDFCIRNNNFTGSLPAEIQTTWECATKV